MKYILTTRLTQDALESLFSQIRGLGRFNDHPSPSEVIIRLKKLLLSNKLPALSPKINHNDSTEKLESYLTGEMLESAFASSELNEDNEIVDVQENDFINFEDFFDDSSIFQSEITNSLTETEEEALAFIAGFIARREREKNNDSSLGSLTKNICDTPPYAEWIMKLSAGGLTVPTPSWMETVKKWMLYFVTFTGKIFKKVEECELIVLLNLYTFPFLPHI